MPQINQKVVEDSWFEPDHLIPKSVELTQP